MLIHSSVDENLVCIYLLVVMNNAYMNICIWLTCGHIFSGLWGMYFGMELLNHMVILCLSLRMTASFPKYLYNFRSLPHKNLKGSISPNPHQHWLTFAFLILIILLDVKWYLIVVMICISLMNDDVEKLFMCLFAFMYYFEIYPNSLLTFQIELFVSLLLRQFIYSEH